MRRVQRAPTGYPEAGGIVISENGGSGEKLQVLVQYQLIAALQEREHDLAEHDRRCRALAAIAGDASVTLYEADGRVELATARASALPLSLGDVQDPTGLSFIHTDDVARVRRELNCLHTSPGTRLHTSFRVLAAQAAGLVELHGVNATEDPILRGTLISHTNAGRPRHSPLVPATRDPLTGLANHALLLDYARRAMDRAVRYGWSTAVVVVDIDDFHAINESRGHEVGDEVLVELAARLSGALRMSDGVGRAHLSGAVDDDVVSRLGGDRFAAVCENVQDEAAARAVAGRIRSLVAKPFALTTGDDVMITVGIGASIAGPSGRSLEQRIRDAEDALRSAKGSGRDRCMVVAEGSTTDRQVRRDAERALQQALDLHEFLVHYQPKVSLESDRVTGAEALLRWQHPARGLVPPLEFIPLAEESGLIVPIGAWVIEESCRQIADWHRRFPRRPPLVIAVNVSGRQLGPALIATVAEALATTGAAPGQLCLEVTESTLITDADGAVETLQRLAALGVKLSIDDFGTGYSSLAYLKRLPLHELKIDKTFVDGLGDDSDDTAIAAATVALSHALGLSVVAEGVETADQLDRLRVIGCQEAQGYFIARPMPADAFTQLLLTEAASGWRAADAAALTDAYRPHRVLIVDDAADVRQLARMALAASGFDVFDTASGVDAVSMAEQLRPDCVILDVSMPGMSGMEVCRALRDDPGNAGCTILMLTGNSGTDQRIEAFAGGADDYIIKPFSPRDLVSRVRAALRLHHTARPTGFPPRPVERMGPEA